MFPLLVLERGDEGTISGRKVGPVDMLNPLLLLAPPVCHPNPVDVRQDAYGSELAFRGRFGLGYQASDTLPNELRLISVHLSFVDECSEFVVERVVQSG